MRTLAIDCATEACSVALFEGPELLASDYAILGRGHAERLVPMIAALPGKGRAERILVSRGPGSFTGVRIGLAAARALAFAWQAECLGYPSLALVAAQANPDRSRPVTVCMHGGHGEWLVQNFDATNAPQDDAQSLTPEAASAACIHPLIAGNRASELAALFDPGERMAMDLLPDARHALLLGSTQISSQLAPIYSREPDASPIAAAQTGESLR